MAASHRPVVRKASSIRRAGDPSHSWMHSPITRSSIDRRRKPRARLIQDLFGSKPRIDCFLAFMDGYPIGYAILLETYSSFLALPTLYLEDIFVLEEYRKRGAGRALLSDSPRTRPNAAVAAAWSGPFSIGINSRSISMNASAESIWPSGSATELPLLNIIDEPSTLTYTFREAGGVCL